MGLFWLLPLIPVTDGGLYWLVPVVFILLVIRLLQVLSSPEKPKLFYKKAFSPFVQAILDACPILSDV